MIGETVSHYSIVEQLGKGGMGELYIAKDLHLQRTVVLKFLPLSLTRDADAKALFIQEARAASAFDHPNICTIYEVNETGRGQMYIAMARYTGRTLREHLEAAQQRLQAASAAGEKAAPTRAGVAGEKVFASGLGESEILNIALQIAQGLAKAHSKGIVHRDIKPDNIFITEEGVVKILDFGIVKLVGHGGGQKSHSGFGTIAYMAPEELGESTPDPRSDIWSLGVILYQMVSGREPFAGSIDFALMYNIVNANPEPVENLAPGVSPALSHIIHRCLAKNIQERWPSMPALAEALQAAGKPRQPVRLLPWQVLAAGVGLVILVLTLLAIGLKDYWLLTDYNRQKITLVVGLVQNRTSDPQLNTIAGLLSSTLEKSRNLAVVPPAEVQDYLNRRKLEAGAFDEKIGRAVCRENEASLLLLPSVAPSGAAIRLQCCLRSMETDSAWTFKRLIPSRDSIYVAVDTIADSIRLIARENRWDVKKNPSNVGQATSPNLEAYQYYHFGELELKKVQLVQARSNFLQAVRLDSTFGQAYYQLANIALWLDGDPVSAHALFRRAAGFNLTDRQRLLLKANMAAIERGPREGLELLQTVTKQYQDDRDVQYLIAGWSFDLGHYQDTIRILEKLLAKDPAYEMPYSRIIDCYRLIHRHDLAEKMHAQYALHNPNAGLRLQGWQKFHNNDLPAARTIFLEELHRDARSPDGLMGMARTALAQGDTTLLLDSVRRFGDAGYNRLWFEWISSMLAAAGHRTTSDSLYQAWRKKYKEQQHPLAINHSDLLLYEERYDDSEKLLLRWCTPARLSSFHLLTLEQLLYTYIYQGHFQRANRLLREMADWCSSNHLLAHEGRYLVMQRLLQLCQEPHADAATDDSRLEELIPSISSPEFWEPYYYYWLLRNEPARAENILSTHLPFWRLVSVRQTLTTAWSHHDLLATAVDSLLHPRHPNHYEVKPLPVAVYYHLAESAALAGHWADTERFARLLQNSYQNQFGLRAAFYPKTIALLAQAAEHQGRPQQARIHYRKLLSLWSKADAAVPEVQRARAKISTLSRR